MFRRLNFLRFKRIKCDEPKQRAWLECCKNSEVLNFRLFANTKIKINDVLIHYCRVVSLRFRNVRRAFKKSLHTLDEVKVA